MSWSMLSMIVAKFDVGHAVPVRPGPPGKRVSPVRRCPSTATVSPPGPKQVVGGGTGLPVSPRVEVCQLVGPDGGVVGVGEGGDAEGGGDFRDGEDVVEVGVGKHDRSHVEPALSHGCQNTSRVVAGIDDERVVVAGGVHEPAVGFQGPHDDAVERDPAAKSATGGVRNWRHGGRGPRLRRGRGW